MRRGERNRGRKGEETDGDRWGEKDKCGKTDGKRELKGEGEEMEGWIERGEGGVL